MQTTADPYPSAAVSLATDGKGELERIRYMLKQISGKSQWYVDAAAIGSKGADVASAAALPVLTDGNFFDVTGTTAITSINTLGVGSVIRLQFDASLILTHHATDLILPDAKNIQTKVGDIATFFEYAAGDWFLTSYSRSRAESLVGYRRPKLTYVSATLVDVENNTGTANQTTIVFPDGDTRSVTEDTGSANKYRRFDITADAEFTSGTEDSGLRAALSEATNTWYAIYAVKSLINTANFVLAGDTTLPLQANFATLNTAYGTNGWVYLGCIRNGDANAATGDILSFVQHGPITYFRNTNTGSSGIATNGMLLANTASGTSVGWTYAAGTGTTDVPNQILMGFIAFSRSTPASDKAFSSSGTGTLHNILLDGAAVISAFSNLNDNLTVASATTAVGLTITLAGYVDGILSGGTNPLL